MSGSALPEPQPSTSMNTLLIPLQTDSHYIGRTREQFILRNCLPWSLNLKSNSYHNILFLPEVEQTFDNPRQGSKMQTALILGYPWINDQVS